MLIRFTYSPLRVDRTFWVERHAARRLPAQWSACSGLYLHPSLYPTLMSPGASALACAVRQVPHLLYRQRKRGAALTALCAIRGAARPRAASTGRGFLLHPAPTTHPT